MMASPTTDAAFGLSDLVSAMQEDPPVFSEYDLWAGRIRRHAPGATDVGYPVYDEQGALANWQARPEAQLLRKPPAKRRR